jgi:hypothetical protein
MNRRLILLALTAVVAVGVGSSAALAGGGNSANAQACQKGGWMNWVRADKTPFTNQGGCVSYAAQGGTLTLPIRPSE